MSAETKNTQSYSIKEAAELSGLLESTLRYYETIGLMKPISRDSSSRHRRYTADDIDYAVAVACLNATGMSIEDMRAYLGNRDKGAHSAQEQIALLEGHKRHLTEEAHSLHLRQRYIDAKIAYWRAVLAGDAARAEKIGESVRVISRELRTSREKLSRAADVTGADVAELP
jgi:DNA-binding transcriptional MerR regulator